MVKIRIKLRSWFHALVRPWFISLIGDKEIWYFQGIRRSGNHACIDWLINARLGEAVEPKELSHYLFYKYSDDLVFINSYAQESAVAMLWHVLLNRRALKKASILVVSLEDESSELDHFLNLLELANFHIGITRLLPNVFSSRIKKMQTERLKNEGGIGRNFEIDERVASLFFEARRAPMVWHYDSWLTDATWRKEFLRRLYLEVDLIPSITSQGGGSSFGAGDSSNQDKRFLSIQCPENLKPMIEAMLQKLPADEKEIAEQWLRQG
jgi:hypothetical protein